MIIRVGISLLAILFFAEKGNAGQQHSQPVSPPDITVIKATIRDVPPTWAVMQRDLIQTMNEAAPLFLKKFVNRDGTLLEHGKLDDDYECFNSWPLFYIIGGDEKLLDWSLKSWNAITQQWTYTHSKSVYKEFVKSYDMLHTSEGYVGFQYFGLADPAITENVERARRFAGFYINEDPEAHNYDPVHKIIRSPFTGSAGPSFESDCGYVLIWGHASLFPVIKALEPGWEKDPQRRAEIQKVYNEVVACGDVPMNLAITGLVTHAYILTGEKKYKDWVLEYVNAWMERTQQNNGIIPDNVGLNGIIGEKRNGQWWGGFFGWSGRYSNWMIFHALITATECSYLMTADTKYLDFLRSQITYLLNLAIIRDGNLLIPYKMGPDGWYDYRPLEPYIISHLWHASMDSKDWELIETLKKGRIHAPDAYAYAKSPNPPAPGSEEWRPDSTFFNWNKIYNDISGNSFILNEPPHLSYLNGTNPDWPVNVLKAEFEQVERNIERLKGATYKHEWQSQTILAQNPIFTNGLAQMTMGAPFTCFNGGLLMARVRYFDMDLARPGLPPDISALVEKLEAGRTVLTLVNTGNSETRKVIIQAGAYRQHEFSEVTFTELSNDTQKKTNVTEKSVPINGSFFVVELPPSTVIRLTIGTKCFVNQPTYAFPWLKN